MGNNQLFRPLLWGMGLSCVLAVGCAPAEEMVAFEDGDNDGIADFIETAFGTDPTDPDSDADGYDDLEEVNNSTDPNDAGDHPYYGGYPMDACRNTVNGTGNGVGDIAKNFSLMDQFGDQVSLHDFCGHAIVIVSSAFW